MQFRREIMATWVVHMMVVDRLFESGLNLDERAFTIGNIAPDCNIENEDWTSFTPPREVTHWMSGKSKLTADYQGFYDAYILNSPDMDFEKMSFMFGYYSHLIVDVEFQRFMRDDERVKAIFRRVKKHPHMANQIKGMPHTFDTIKSVFGKNNAFYDIHQQEMNYLDRHIDSRYHSILKKTHTFPDYIDYLPQGAIVRKLKGITNYLSKDKQRTDFVFFSEKEIHDFVTSTSQIIIEKLNEKLIDRGLLARL